MPYRPPRTARPIRSLTLTGALLLGTSLTAGCALEDGDDGDGGGGAAHPGVRVEFVDLPTVSIDDEFGTEVAVRLQLDHLGGPDVTSFEVLSASLQLDLEEFADLELQIPDDHPGFDTLPDGDSKELVLRDALDMTNTDWGLCASGADEANDELRVTITVEVKLMPGANDEDDVVMLERYAVNLNCVFVG